MTKEKSTKEKNMWRLDLDYAEKAILTDFKCSAENCDDIAKYLITDLAKEVMTFKDKLEHVYDQPYAVRSLLGVLGYINDFTERPIETTHMSVNAEKKNLNLFFNCKKDSVLAVLESPIPSNKVEASYSQNLLDNLGLPNELYVELHEMM
jgi:hypothetical protein